MRSPTLSTRGRLRRAIPRLTAVLLLTTGLARLGAHDTTPPSAADVLVTPQGTQLTVLVTMPVAVVSDVVSDANLAGSGSGPLGLDLEQSLQLVARDVAAGLDLEQGDEGLATAATRASLTPDGAFAIIELVYRMRPDAESPSARLYAFRAGGIMVPMVVRFAVSPGVSRTYTVTGDPARVVFSPSPLQALRQFIPRGTAAVLKGWSVLLFALCLAVPFRRHRSLRAACAALLAGEGLSSVLTASGAIVVTPGVLAATQAIAASAIVIASLQGVVGRLSRYLWPLAFGFGAANGFSLGDVFHHARLLAGDSPALAYAGFLFVILAGQLWMLTLLTTSVGLLYRWGLPERLAAIGVSVYAAHAALHRLNDHAAVVAESTTMTAGDFLTALVIAWALVVLAVGVIETLRVGGDARTLDPAGGHTR